jgi:hypothetical protein
MKIALTGHLAGLGECLYKMLSDAGHTVVGFDIQEGCDINNKDVRSSILEKSKDCDVFINNAYANPGQFELLRLLIDSNIHSIIMNVGTNITDVAQEWLDNDPDWQEQSQSFRSAYPIQKKLQNDYIRNKRQQHKGKSILLTVKPGWLNTSLVNNVPSSRCVDLRHVCEAMIFQIEMATQSVWIPDINVVPLLSQENS